MVEGYRSEDFKKTPEALNTSETQGSNKTPEALNTSETQGFNKTPEALNTKNFVDTLSKAFKEKINFNIKGKPDPKISSRLGESYDGNESLSGILANNEQVQLLLSNLLSEYSVYIGQDKERLKQLINQGNLQGEQADMATNYYEYLLTNDNVEGFLDFLVSSDCISDVLLTYLSIHTDNNSNVNFISERDIKAKIKAAYNKKLFENYSADMHNASIEELRNLNTMGALIKNKIDNVIYGYLSKGKNAWGDGDFITTLSNLYEKVKNNIGKTKDAKYSEDQIFYMLRTSIKEYSRLLNLSDENRGLKRSDDNKDDVFDIQLRSYLFLYGKLLNGDNFKSIEGGLTSYEGELGELLDAILSEDGYFKKGKKDGNKYNNIEASRHKDWMNRDRDRNDQHMRRNRPPIKPLEKPELPVLPETENLDINEASGYEIAQEMGLGDGLKDFKIRETLPNSNILRQGYIFKKTCDDFIKENGRELGKFRTSPYRLFRPGPHGLTINQPELNNKLSGLDNTEKFEFEVLLNKFVNKYRGNVKEISNEMDNIKETAHETIKTHAIGAVIDNIKDMFQNIINSNNTGILVNGFEFNENNAAKIENHNLIISGKFNGEPLILRYNLETGELFMNAYISKIEEGGTPAIIIGDNSPTQRVGKLRPFQEILDSFYEKPTESIFDEISAKNRRTPQSRQNPNDNKDGKGSNTPRRRRGPRGNPRERERNMEENKRKFQEMCGNTIDEIKLNVKNEVETMSIQNHTVSNLLRTLNVISDDGNINSTKKFMGGSNLYRIVQLITNKKNEISDIDTFSNYMQILMDYIGLTWGRNIDKPDRTKEEKSEIIFNENNKQKYISIVRENTKNFAREYEKLSKNGQFDGNSNFGILKIIEENFTDGDYPNWKLDSNKIKNFKNNLISNIKEAHVKTTEVEEVEKKMEKNNDWE